jgi:4-hydroxy-tetrahydrodipicolinate synthase
MNSPRFGALLTAMVTPFDSSGAVDIDASVALARYLVEHGSDGLVVAGSTGEGSALSDDEKVALFAAVAETVTVPVLAGTSSADTAASVALTRRASDVGIAGILATTPAYARPSQSGIAQHLAAIADATPLPVMLYDIPSRTGRAIHPSTTIELVRTVANIVALKDASGQLAAAAQTKATLGDDFDLYSGDDALTLPFMAIGAVGVVSVCSHWAGDEMSAMIRHASANEWEVARRINASLASSYAFEGSEAYPNPVPAKAAMRALGLNVGQCRLPLGDSDDVIDYAASSLVSTLTAARV